MLGTADAAADEDETVAVEHGETGAGPIGEGFEGGHDRTTEHGEREIRRQTQERAKRLSLVLLRGMRRSSAFCFTKALIGTGRTPRPSAALAHLYRGWRAAPQKQRGGRK